MSMFGRDESLLVAIHDGQTVIDSRDVSAFIQLLAQGLVSGKESAQGRYVDVTLTSEGKVRIPGIIQRD
jgi:hypothetical protein